MRVSRAPELWRAQLRRQFIVAFRSEADIFSGVFVVPLSNGIRSRSRQTSGSGTVRPLNSGEPSYDAIQSRLYSAKVALPSVNFHETFGSE